MTKNKQARVVVLNNVAQRIVDEARGQHSADRVGVFVPMTRDGILPRGLTSINQGGTPAPALFLSALVSIALVVSGTFDILIAIASVLFVLVYLSGFRSLLALRRREPHLSRPYKAWWYPWSTVCVLVASISFLVGAVLGDLEHSLFTAILILLSYLSSVVIVRRKAGQSTPLLPGGPRSG